MPYETIYDIKMSNDGDLIIASDDLELVNGIEWFIQEVRKIVRTNNPDWSIHPNIGANIDDFAGQPNTREIGKKMEQQLYEAITAENIQFPGVLTVKVIPVSADSVNAYINVDIEGVRIPISKILFDYANGIISESIDDEPSAITAENSSSIGVSKNPYFSRL